MHNDVVQVLNGGAPANLRSLGNQERLGRDRDKIAIYESQFRGGANLGAAMSVLQQIHSTGRIATEFRRAQVLSEWREYLSKLRPRYPKIQIDALQSIWQSLSSKVSSLLPPHAGPAEDGSLQMAWDQGEHHVDVDILEDGTFEWLYTAGRLRVVEGDEGLRTTEPVPDALIARLRLLVSAR